MFDTEVRFGYNDDTVTSDYVSWEKMGSKYNFNIAGKALGVFECNGHDYLLSQVTESFADNCMAGTVDVREISLFNDFLISNNEITEECMTISRTLSSKDAMEKLKEGMPVEQTKGFSTLANLGIMLNRKDMNLDSEVSVYGVEKEKFEEIKSKTMNQGRSL